ncbi:MAG TPA: four helix bundle protein [Vicinamibacterales bacterium]|nr:four helix bundle protein [Vicinamibacterales bacterium]
MFRQNEVIRAQFSQRLAFLQGENFAYAERFKGVFLPDYRRSFVCTERCMKEPSPKRKRTLALQERAILFSVNVNACCPEYFSNEPSKVVWGQLVRAADSTSNNLVEADDGVSDADFLNKMGTALKEAKESRVALMKLRLGKLHNYHKTEQLELESEARQLSAIFATIIRNMEARLAREKAESLKLKLKLKSN